MRNGNLGEADLQSLKAEKDRERAVGRLYTDFSVWAYGRLTVPIAPHAGEPWIVMPWFRDWIEATFGNDEITESGLSLSRKNGKTSSICAVLAGMFFCPDSPLYVTDERAIFAALQKSLADEAQDYLELLLKRSGIPHKRRQNYIEEVGTANRVTFLTGSRIQGQGRAGTTLAVLDEGGLMFSDKREVYANFRGSIVGTGGRVVLLGVQSIGPIFADLRQRALSGKYPNVVCHTYEAPPNTDVDDWEAIKAANPGLGRTVNARALKALAREAADDPQKELEFRMWHRNERVHDERVAVIELADHDRCVTEDELPPRDGPCYLGLDFGGASSMSGAAAYWPDTGRLEIKGCFPETPDLGVRGRNDSVGQMYLAAKNAGQLVCFGNRVTDVGAFLKWVRDVWLGEDVWIEALCADRYRRTEVLEYLEAADWESEIIWRGQGAGAKADGTLDVYATQRLFKAGKVRLHPSMLLTQALAQAELRFDPGGNPALQKAEGSGVNKSRARIDALSALVVAIGSATKFHE